jgi:hypothetical protein
MRVRNKEIRNARKRLEERIKSRIRDAKAAAAGATKGKGRRKATTAAAE